MRPSAVIVSIVVVANLCLQPATDAGVRPSVGAHAASIGRPVSSSTSIAAPSPSQDRRIVVLQDGSNALKVARDHERRFGVHPIFVYGNVMDGYAAVMDAAQVAAIEAEPGVQFVDLDPAEDPPPAVAAPSPEQTPQVSGTSIGRIDADESSAVAGDGKGSVNVNVAVLDTGVQPDHPDLNVVNGFNCIGPNVGTNPKDWADPAGHGTLVAGFLGARDNKIARLGVAPGVRISSCPSPGRPRFWVQLRHHLRDGLGRGHAHRRPIK